jgi:hypothetical protein
MERTEVKGTLLNTFLPAAIVVVIAFALVVMAFGFDGVAKGAHDVFHDFRHTIGMPCH